MASAEQAFRIDGSDARWPTGLARLGRDAPQNLTLCGSDGLLRRSAVALFCSVRAPGRVVVESYDLARRLAQSPITLVGGFQSPVEREVLDYLLRGCASAIVCPARGLYRIDVPPRWRLALEQERLLIVTPFPERLRRPTAASAEYRNRMAAALAERLLILHATPGGRLARLAIEASAWGMPLYCFDHPRNEDLRLIGALSLQAGGGFHGVSRTAI